MHMELNKFVREHRKKMHLTQPEMALKVGVGLRFVRELEQGKKTLRIDKVNQVLKLFDHEIGAVEIKNEEYKPAEIDEDIIALQ